MKTEKFDRTITNELSNYIYFFLINPVLCLFAAGRYSMKNNSYVGIYVFAILLALYASGINTTNMPDSDQENYLEQYIRVPEKGLYGTIAYTGELSSGSSDVVKEPLYGAIVFFSYYLLFGSNKMFFLFSSFLILLFHYLAIINVGKKYEHKPYIILCSILTLTFFTQFFSFIIHTNRQLLATGVMLYALSLRVLQPHKRLRNIAWLVASPLIHTMTLLPIAFYFLPRINGEYTKKNLIFILIISMSFASFFLIVSHFLPQNSSGLLGYAMSRAANADPTENGYLASDSTIVFGFSIMIIFFAILSYLKQRDFTPPIIMNIAIIMSGFVMGYSYNTLFQSRYLFLLYSFVPFTVPFLFKPNSLSSKVYCSCLATAMIIRFVILLPQSTWKYGELHELLLYPFPLLFTINPY